MTNSMPGSGGKDSQQPNSQPQDPASSVRTDTDQLQEAENEGLAPIVPANPAVQPKTDAAS